MPCTLLNVFDVLYRQDPVWLTDVRGSKETPPHLFHCEYTFKDNDSECRGEYQHEKKVIKITCGKLSQ